MPDHSLSSSASPKQDGALLAFFLGPVQPFIAGARTVRDLWTGSYLLAWLTFAAIQKVLDAPGTSLETPDLPEDHPLRWTILKNGKPPPGVTTPCIPNLLALPWDRLWNAQVSCFFEVRSVVLFPGRLTDEIRKRLLDPDPQNDREAQMSILFGMMDACKSVRHVPNYKAEGDVPQKCTLLGTYEQMGPAALDESREFWKVFAKQIHLPGTRIGKGERLCALSLVKRFAWPAYLLEALGVKDVRDLHYSDTATVAAKRWLRGDGKKEDRELDPGAIRRHFGEWSGQWLHWRKRDQDSDDPCPEGIWKALEPALAAKRRAQGPAPAYYAILMADADKLGDRLATQGKKVSAALTQFALGAARAIVEGDEYGGELIYSGGDDTLALLPTEAAIACARALQLRYEANWHDHFRDGQAATLSAGLAVVHYKEDLRFALEAARTAEHTAKVAGRNALVIAVCRRSGEHTSAVVGWDQLQHLGTLVRFFLNGVSDRWTYKLRTLLPTLQGLPWESFEAELGRVLRRVESVAGVDMAAFQKAPLDFCREYRAEMMDERKRNREAVMTDFITLCQSASFLARGRDAR